MSRYWNSDKSSLPKKGEGEQHLTAKEVTATYIYRKYGYNYRFEYPVVYGIYQHTYDIVFYHPLAVIDSYPVKDIMQYSNEFLLKLPFKGELDKIIQVVVEIDDYTQHTHTEQRINDGEAEAIAQQLFQPDLKFMRFKKEELVSEKKVIVEKEDAEKHLRDQCIGLKKTYLVK
jgi:hypothetical protein